jgi:hypothetical protein
MLSPGSEMRRTVQLGQGDRVCELQKQPSYRSGVVLGNAKTNTVGDPGF